MVPVILCAMESKIANLRKTEEKKKEKKRSLGHLEIVRIKIFAKTCLKVSTCILWVNMNEIRCKAIIEFLKI